MKSTNKGVRYESSQLVTGFRLGTRYLMPPTCKYEDIIKITNPSYCHTKNPDSSTKIVFFLTITVSNVAVLLQSQAHFQILSWANRGRHHHHFFHLC